MSDVVSRLILHYQNKARVRAWIIHHVIDLLFRFAATHIILALLYSFHRWMQRDWKVEREKNKKMFSWHLETDRTVADCSTSVLEAECSMF